MDASAALISGTRSPASTQSRPLQEFPVALVYSNAWVLGVRLHMEQIRYNRPDTYSRQYRNTFGWHVDPIASTTEQ